MTLSRTQLQTKHHKPYFCTLSYNREALGMTQTSATKEQEILRSLKWNKVGYPQWLNKVLKMFD